MTARESGGKGGARKLTHAHAKLLFSKAWDGEITGEELRALTEHLQGCAKCAAATGRMRAFMRRVEDLLRGG